MQSVSPVAVDMTPVRGVGGNIDPQDLLDIKGHSPSGAQLAQQLAGYGVQLVRLVWGNVDPSAYRKGGWRTIFSRLNAVHINALLTLHSQPTGAGSGPGVKNDRITDLRAVVKAEESLLATVKSQNGGRYPSNLVALDVFNEPVLDAQTAPVLQRLAETIRNCAGLPVTIGGWRDDATTRTPQDFNNPDLAGLASGIGDFVSVHLYPESKGGPAIASNSDYSTTDPSFFAHFVQSFLSTAISSIASAGHAGMTVLISETGAQSGQAPGVGFASGKTLGSPAHQVAVLTAVFSGAKGDQSQGVVGVLSWAIVPPHSKICDAPSLLCVHGKYTSPALSLLASNQF